MIVSCIIMWQPLEWTHSPLYIWTPSSRGKARGWCRWFPVCGRLSPGSWCSPLSGSGENSPPLHKSAPSGNAVPDLVGRPRAELWLWRAGPRCPCVSLCPPLVQFQSMRIPPPVASPVPSRTSETGPLLTWHPWSAADYQSAVILFWESLTPFSIPCTNMPHSSTIFGHHNSLYTLAHTQR